MKVDERGKTAVINYISVALPVLIFTAMYWVFDAVLDAFVFRETDFLTSLMTPDPMCLSMRLMNLPIILVFAVIAQWMLIKRRSAENDMKKERNRAQRYLDIAGAIFLVVDHDQKISLINKLGCQIIGYEAKDIIGKNWFETFVPESIRDQKKESFRKLMDSSGGTFEYSESPIIINSREERMISWNSTVLRNGKAVGILSYGQDITERKRAEEALEEEHRRLQKALDDVRTLRGIVPICASCKKIRDDRGYWNQVEKYVSEHSEAEFSHGICPECLKKLYPEFAEDESGAKP